MGCGHSTLSCCKPPKKVKGAGGEVCLRKGGVEPLRRRDPQRRGLAPVGRGARRRAGRGPHRGRWGRLGPVALFLQPGLSRRGSGVCKHGPWAQEGQLIPAARVGKLCCLWQVPVSFSLALLAVWPRTSDLPSLALRLSHRPAADHLQGRYSQSGPRIHSIRITWDLLEMRNLRLCPRPAKTEPVF